MFWRDVNSIRFGFLYSQLLRQCLDRVLQDIRRDRFVGNGSATGKTAFSMFSEVIRYFCFFEMLWRS